MKSKSITKLINLMAIALFTIAIAFTPVSSSFAGTVKSNSADTAKQAAQEVIKDTGAKEQFGQTENGDKLIDKAQAKASQKLDEISKTEGTSQQSNSEQKFLKNLQGE